MKTSDKIASSGTKQGIINLLNDYLYSTSCTINFETGDCFNANGKISVRCKYEKKRYILY